MARRSKIVLLSEREPSLLTAQLERMEIPFIRYDRLDEVEDYSGRVVFVELSWDLERLYRQVEKLENFPSVWTLPLVIITPVIPEQKHLDELKKLTSRLRVVEVSAEQADSGTLSSSLFSGFVDAISGPDEPEPAPRVVRRSNDQGGISDILARELQFGDKSSGDVHKQIVKAQALLGGLPLTVGGAPYSSLKAPIKLDRALYTPEDEHYQKLVRDVLALSNEWESEHFKRVAYIVRSILVTLRLEEEDLELGVTLAYLYAWPHGLSNSLISKQPYTRKGQELHRANFMKSLEANSDTVQEFLSETSLAEAIAHMSVLLGREPRLPEVDVLTTLGSVVLLADLVDRECFSGTRFSSRSGYHLLRWIERGEAVHFDGGALALVIQFLTEAMEAAPPRVAGPALDRPPAGASLVKVRFSHLQPGMRLGTTLKSIDGREILQQGVTFDSDLIWRLWRISAVVPMKLPEVEAASIRI